jgi:phospholipid/cholesterol/gamma-HCH transport system substrate-binding protein
MSDSQRRSLAIGAAVLALVLIAAGFTWYRISHRTIAVTAYFTQAIGVYPGSNVRVLGVDVGVVDATQPVGRLVKVTMSVSAKVPVPANAKAVLVTSGVVADRYIQFTPAYTGGPQLTSGAVIPVSRTAVPLEVDQIYTSLSKFFTALGPNGINKHGALSSLIKTGAKTLGGNGQNFNAMITEFSRLNQTLGGTSGDFFATIAHLGVFNSMLAKNDGQVKLAEQQLASVTGFFAADRHSLAAALDELATALGQVRTFIADNRSLIKSNVTKLASVTHLLATERASLAEALSTAPLAVDNLLNAYDSTDHTLLGRGDLNELSFGPAAKLLGGADALPAGAEPISGAAMAALPPLPLPSVGTVYGSPGTALTSAGRK